MELNKTVEARDGTLVQSVRRQRACESLFESTEGGWARRCVIDPSVSPWRFFLLRNAVAYSTMSV